jgi:hypothetical protein
MVDPGDGRWRVATDPEAVSTVTVVSLTGTVSVVVPPYEVTTCETVGLEATEVETVWPVESMYETEVAGVDETDGDETKFEAEIEVTVCPDSTTVGVDEDGAGV